MMYPVYSYYEALEYVEERLQEIWVEYTQDIVYSREIVYLVQEVSDYTYPSTHFLESVIKAVNDRILHES